MKKSHQPLFSESYLRSYFTKDFDEFSGSEKERRLINRLNLWNEKSFQKETSAESAFLNVFFEETWGYGQSGKSMPETGFSCYPKFPVAGAGAGGGTGEADGALGYFDNPDISATPQVLCEFKDIRSNLDAPQQRKGNTRTPVKQCGDYLREASKLLYGNEAIQPTWGIVTDMNEFRLYWRNNMPAQYQRFSINPKTGDDVIGLLGNSEEARFQRFLFATIFSTDYLLTTGGPSPLLQLLHKQWVREKEIENVFYKEYRAYRESLIKLVIAHNPSFQGTKGKRVRLAQKLIDRCIFVLFCEDMGEALSFPPNALRDYLAELSQMAAYDEQAGDAWSKLKELFQAMNEGHTFFSKPINRFNGGLFAQDTELEQLYVPNEVFCARMQGENEESLASHPDTLLYLSAVYNFGSAGDAGRAITLYTLGRIFEQSITELEALEAKAENRPSLTEITKRKRDGVYYTPEWVVENIVRETLGPRLDEIRRECGWSVEIEGDDELVAKQRERSPSKQSADFKRHVAGVRKYREHLETFTVCDPACGSGAFLIHSLEYLLRERRRTVEELERVEKVGLLEFKPDDEIRHILSRNIYGVDINPASMEIAQLALWLHTAKGDQPLSNLENNIRCGNSLIGPDFYEWRRDLLSWSETRKETVNVFDWEAAFPEIFAEDRPNGPGFDCVIGNPPYVKLQNFRKVHPEMANYLKGGELRAGTPVYESTQSGNFDLFLPFIEKSIALLNGTGRLGFIAPSLWRYNEYGQGLRRFLHRGGHLDRWIDFESFQVFKEAITYTALQFYTKERRNNVRLALAPSGEIARAADWDDPEWSVDYSELPQNDPWIFVSRPERAILQKLSKGCRRLGDREITRSIFQGLITSADHVYHLDRIAADLYLQHPKKLPGQKTKPEPIELEIEDAIMHPLVSGEQANRYQEPDTNTYILFPYLISDGDVRLFTLQEMKDHYPKTLRYLNSYEDELRNRENGKMNLDGKWWGYNYPKNLDKQEHRKLLVPRLCLNLAFTADAEGRCYIDNVDVGGVEPTDLDDTFFLVGVLNSAVCDFVWKRIAKPFQNGYRSANKQFIAPLPIPEASSEQKAEVSAIAKKLSTLHTMRRDTLRNIEHRLSHCSIEERPEKWLWPIVQDIGYWNSKAPPELTKREKTRWAKKEFNRRVEEQLHALTLAMRPGLPIVPSFVNGELTLTIGGATAIDGIFLADNEGRKALLSWRHLARTVSITEGLTAKALTRKLRTLHLSDNPALVAQLSELDVEYESVEQEICQAEAEMNQLAYKLYRLTEDEINLIHEG